MFYSKIGKVTCRTNFSHGEDIFYLPYCWIEWGAGDNKIGLLQRSIHPTRLYIQNIIFCSPPPSIVLDGEPETIKEFAAKQHQIHRTLHSKHSILVTSP